VTETIETVRVALYIISAGGVMIVFSVLAPAAPEPAWAHGVGESVDYHRFRGIIGGASLITGAWLMTVREWLAGQFGGDGA